MHLVGLKTIDLYHLIIHLNMMILSCLCKELSDFKKYVKWFASVEDDTRRELPFYYYFVYSLISLLRAVYMVFKNVS